ncbi:MAG: YfiR family protein [Deltaproteobacteria bacterium]|nr:YfiR family protein [Deltaproteobacteria bacterium]
MLFPLHGAAEEWGEIDVKAAFLFNFARFLSWPEEAFAFPDSPIVFGILGDPEFFETASATITGKTVNDRPVEVRELQDDSEAKKVHLLFLARALETQGDSIRTAVGESPVFVIADFEGFAANGGTAHFYMDHDRVRFAINLRVAQEKGLTISSKLLRVATLVE